MQECQPPNMPTCQHAPETWTSATSKLLPLLGSDSLHSRLTLEYKQMLVSVGVKRYNSTMAKMKQSDILVVDRSNDRLILPNFFLKTNLLFWKFQTIYKWRPITQALKEIKLFKCYMAKYEINKWSFVLSGVYRKPKIQS